jgi:hypothetical protein
MSEQALKGPAAEETLRNYFLSIGYLPHRRLSEFSGRKVFSPFLALMVASSPRLIAAPTFEHSDLNTA